MAQRSHGITIPWHNDSMAHTIPWHTRSHGITIPWHNYPMAQATIPWHKQPSHGMMIPWHDDPMPSRCHDGQKDNTRHMHKTCVGRNHLDPLRVSLGKLDPDIQKSPVANTLHSKITDDSHGSRSAVVRHTHCDESGGSSCTSGHPSHSEEPPAALPSRHPEARQTSTAPAGVRRHGRVRCAC
jgi:hypothetical protein